MRMLNVERSMLNVEFAHPFNIQHSTLTIQHEPALMIVGEGHSARCYLHGELADPERG